MAAWYDQAVFYHIYPIGLSGAPRQNNEEGVVNRLTPMEEWIPHIKKIGCTAIYIGPLFESVGHGYETIDYKLVDRRLGSNQDFKHFVSTCHEMGIKVIVDGVFNHVGREFFAFLDVKEKRENSVYKDWFCNVNFWGNNEYNDGFCYDNWGGYNLLVKLNQKNPAVKDYIYDVIRFWVSEFDIDGIRLDAADVLDFDFMKGIRHCANEVKKDFWLMGEVIHGDYGRWANQETLHSVTNYELHKAFFSGHNDHNYFEIAHSVKRLLGLCGNTNLYTFVDNHDVARIASKVNNKEHLIPIHYLLYTLPGIPSIYYGSEFAIEGPKMKGSDDNLRPALNLEDYKDAYEKNPITKLITALGKVKAHYHELTDGKYQELVLTNRQYAFARVLNDSEIIVVVNNDDKEAEISIPVQKSDCAIDVFTREKISVQNGRVSIKIAKNSGRILYSGVEKESPIEKELEELEDLEDKIQLEVREEGTGIEIRPVEKVEHKKEITSKILGHLPDWFGIPNSTQEYIEASSQMKYWAAFEGNNPIGFVALKEHNPYTAELYVMGVEQEYHRRGIGRSLVQSCYGYCKEKGVEFLQVKTIDESNPNAFYAKTREFYKTLGFKPIECFENLWGKNNPCLLLMLYLGNENV